MRDDMDTWRGTDVANFFVKLDVPATQTKPNVGCWEALYESPRLNATNKTLAIVYAIKKTHTHYTLTVGNKSEAHFEWPSRYRSHVIGTQGCVMLRILSSPVSYTK